MGLTWHFSINEYDCSETKDSGLLRSPVIKPLIDSPPIFHPPDSATTLAIVLSWQPLAVRGLCCEQERGWWCIVIYHASILFDSSEIGIISSSKLQLLFIKLESWVCRGVVCACGGVMNPCCRGVGGNPDIIITIIKTAQRILIGIKLNPPLGENMHFKTQSKRNRKTAKDIEYTQKHSRKFLLYNSSRTTISLGPVFMPRILWYIMNNM